jgi:hypothetical protein
MACDHRRYVGWARSLLMIEFAPRKCPACGETIGYPPSQIALANLILLLGVAVCVAMSIKLRSWWPYALLIVFYAIERSWIKLHGSLRKTPAHRGLTAVWFIILVVFILLLARFARP